MLETWQAVVLDTFTHPLPSRPLGPGVGAHQCAEQLLPRLQHPALFAKLSARTHLVLALGRTSTLNSCFPVHNSMGLSMAGVGMSTGSNPSDMPAASSANSERVRKRSLPLMR